MTWEKEIRCAHVLLRLKEPCAIVSCALYRQASSMGWLPKENSVDDVRVEQQLIQGGQGWRQLLRGLTLTARDTLSLWHPVDLSQKPMSNLEDLLKVISAASLTTLLVHFCLPLSVTMSFQLTALCLEQCLTQLEPYTELHFKVCMCLALLATSSYLKNGGFFNVHNEVKQLTTLRLATIECFSLLWGRLTLEKHELSKGVKCVQLQPPFILSFCAHIHLSFLQLLQHSRQRSTCLNSLTVSKFPFLVPKSNVDCTAKMWLFCNFSSHSPSPLPVCMILRNLHP